jgi:Cft2 family RNA processing exonuclease
LKRIRFTNLTRQTEIGASCYRLDIGDRRLILDCGLHPKQEGELALPLLDMVAPDSVDAIILSHAHQDHLGCIPLLMRRHHGVPVFCTDATKYLSDIMLHNSVNVMSKIREEEGVADYPLFTHREVEKLRHRWQSCSLHQRWSFTGEKLAAADESEPSFEFFDAGHILGSTGTLIRTVGHTIFYTGDVNFENQTIARAARFPETGIDSLIIECTRGDSPTPVGFTRAAEERRFIDAINAAFERNGCVLVPVFALGKTQEVLVMCHEARKQRRLPKVPIYIGGLSTKFSEQYDRYAHYAPRQHADLQILDTIAPFVLAGREAVNPPIRPRRIYALSSGMMTENTISNGFARRILENPEHSILFVGYADPESPAGKLRAASPGDSVALDSRHPAQKIRAHVEEFTFSAHASRESLREYIRKVSPHNVVLVHGDPQAVSWFHNAVRADLPDSRVIVPPPGQVIDLE